MTICNIDNRVITLMDELTMEDCGNIVHTIATVNRLDEMIMVDKRRAIEFHVNSEGGDIYSMWGIIASVESSKTPVYTYCEGLAMSAAFAIFLSGKKRYASKQSTFMYHQISGWRSGYINNISDGLDEFNRLQKQYDDFVISHTEIEQVDLDSTCKERKEWYIPAEEAKEYGIFESYM